MSKQDYTTGLLVDKTTSEVFEAINNVRGWWSENIEGATNRQGDAFRYQYKDIHRCTIRVTELVPGKKVAWQVEDNYFKFTRDKSEWKGTTIVFDIAEKDGGAALRFTHEGLVPQYECYEVCREAWTHYIQDSLRKLIETGEGEPMRSAEGESFETELVEKRGLAAADLLLSFAVVQTPQQVFEAIMNVRGWWGRGVEGGTGKVGDEFVYRHKDVHYSRHRLVEVVPGVRVVWLTTDSRLNFVVHKDEWTGTTISFEIGEQGGKTTVRFMHAGLTPVLECFAGCKGGWEFYILESLRKLIETGKGEPDPA